LKWDSHLDEFIFQPDLMEDFLHPFKSDINSANTEFEKHIYMWCIENYVPLKQFNSGEIQIVFYEDLCSNLSHTMKSLFTFLGKKSVPFSNFHSKPSALARKDSPINTGSDLLNQWKDNLTDEQVKTSMEILSKFGLDAVYNEGVKPIVNSDEILSFF
jgi:hypothetical protein